jgi:hypothetical protein
MLCCQLPQLLPQAMAANPAQQAMHTFEDF